MDTTTRQAATSASETPLRLGVIGMSEGNGHPYSWSAIFNGYDAARMAQCPFPVIPRYLAERRFPDEYLTKLGQVTHVWAQDPAQARSIAEASRIEHVADSVEAMLPSVDAVLLARDDAEHHRGFAAPVLAAGLPIFIDKPLALSLRDADALLSLQRYEGQLFSCSALRYAPELQVSPADRAAIGRVRLIEATTPKYWATYAVHAIEPFFAAFAAEWTCPLRVRSRVVLRERDLNRLSLVLEDGVLISVTSTGAIPASIGFRVYGELGTREYVFRDSFTAFRGALEAFATGARARSLPIARAETRQIVQCIEWGLAAASP